MNDPSAEPPESATQALRQEVSALDVEDILALCFAFSRDARRLTVYLDVLRGKPGMRAQVAACLICFDLARRGDAAFEAEFLALVPVVREWAHGTAEKMLGDNAYLHELWADLRVRIDDIDARNVGRGMELEVEQAEAIEISLLDEEDLVEIGVDELDALEVDDAAMARAWQRAIDKFADLEPTQQVVDGPPQGFFAQDRRELERVERLRNEAESLQDGVAAAREMLPIVELFLGVHTRARTLFGTRNKTRDAHVRAGLIAFTKLKEPPEHAAGWLDGPTAVEFAWEKVGEVLLDYLQFLASSTPAPELEPPSVELIVDQYMESDRPVPPPQRLADGRRRKWKG